MRGVRVVALGAVLPVLELATHPMDAQSFYGPFMPSPFSMFDPVTSTVCSP